MQKLTKEQMLSELMVKLETIDAKLNKLLENQQVVVVNETRVYPNPIQDSEEFDGAYK